MIAFFLLNLSCHIALVCNFSVRSTTSFNISYKSYNFLYTRNTKICEPLVTFCFKGFFIIIVNISFLHHFIVLPICYFPRQDWVGGCNFFLLVKRGGGVVKKFCMLSEGSYTIFPH